MKRLIYDEPRNRVLLEGGQRIHGGDEFSVEPERALELLTDPTVNVIEAPETHVLDALSRRALDERARELGIDPDTLPNKAAVIEAITNHPQQTGEVGDGTTPTDPTEEV